MKTAKIMRLEDLALYGMYLSDLVFMNRLTLSLNSYKHQATIIVIWLFCNITAGSRSKQSTLISTTLHTLQIHCYTTNKL